MRELLPEPHSVEIVMGREHLSPVDIATFVDQTLPLDRRAELAEHLGECDACREEVAACARLVSSVPAASGNRIPWRVVVGVAAVLLLAATLRSAGRRSGVTEETTVATERSPAVADRIAAILPASDAVVARSRLRFVWRRDPQATGYHIVVTDTNGKPVWSDEVADTALAPPDTTRLVPGARYFWRVDVLHADGSYAQTGEIAFRVAP